MTCAHIAFSLLTISACKSQQKKKKKKFYYINSQMQVSPMNPKETFVWFFFNSDHPLAKRCSQNNGNVCTRI